MRRLGGLGSSLKSAVILSACLLLLSHAGAVGSHGVETAVGPTSDTIPSQHEPEPNDDFGSATNISAPFEATDFEASASDTDIFAVRLEQGDRITAEIAFNDSKGDLDLYLYDPNRDRIRTAASATDDENVTYQAGLTGQYYVVVDGWTSNTNTYDIAVTRSDQPLPDNDQFEYNDGFSSAAEVPPSFDRTGLLLAEGEYDFYAVDLQANTRLNITTLFDNAVSNVNLRVYNQSQDLIAVGFSATDNESVSITTDQDGTYYIEVYSHDRNATAYDLRLESFTIQPTTTTGPTETATETSTRTVTATETSGAGGPGFGVVGALLALLIAAVGLRQPGAQ